MSRNANMAKQSKPQRETVGRVMHEFKHGQLNRRGGPVKNRKQAVAIALREAGASKKQSPKESRESLRRTKTKERRGQTGQAQAESKRMGRHLDRKAAKTRSELYEEAKRRRIPGRSKMSKEQLERVLKRQRD
jgi:hypothetical protein